MSEGLIKKLRESTSDIENASLCLEAADDLEILEAELAAIYGERNFYKLKSEYLEENMSEDLVEGLRAAWGSHRGKDMSQLHKEAGAEIAKLAREKTWLTEQRDNLLDQNIKLRADNNELRAENGTLKYQGQDK